MSDERLLAIPNCSEGTDPDRIDRLVRSCRVPGVHVLDVHSDPDHDRTVITLAGPANALVDAGVALAACAREVIDLREQHGVHPRVGALDVLPFVAMRPSRMPAAVAAARAAGARIAAEVGTPVYLYGEAATKPGRERPARFRTADLSTMPPDFAPPGHRGQTPPGHRGQTPPGAITSWDADGGRTVTDTTGLTVTDTDGGLLSSGVTLVGARGPLVAFNIWLEDGDLDDARGIAAAVREGGDHGGLAGVRALGLMCASTGKAQVSMNIEDFRRTPLRDVVARVRSEAARRGRIIGESELVGLVPRDALTGVTPASLGLPRFNPAQIIPED